MKYYYTYKVTLPETGEFYIGRRLSSVPPEKDSNYKGSMKAWKVDKSILHKEILETYSNLEDLEVAEIQLIEATINHPLNRNAHIPSKGFSTAGLELTEEHKQKISIGYKNLPEEKKQEKRLKTSAFHKNRAKTESQKKRLSESHKGKVFTEEHRKNISKGGEGNSNAKGSIRSDEMKNHLSTLHKGKKWYTDGISNYHSFPGEQPKGTREGITSSKSRVFVSGMKGKKWYTNGIESICTTPGTEPKGFVPGRKQKQAK
jgi:hypothetical protein